jgi:hypothetical protein
MPMSSGESAVNYILIDHIAVLIDGAPQILLLPADLHETSSRGQISPRRPCRRFSFRA